MLGKRWVHVEGDGLLYEGPCLVLDILVTAPTAGDEVDIYDGRDALSGKEFINIKVAANLTWQIALPTGVPFDRGIYVDATDSDVHTTVVFAPLDA